MKEDLDVKFKFDAFPFAEYGVITGKLTKIAPAAEETAAMQPSFYRAYASMDQDYFRVKGERVALLSGMTATAEIVTESKTVLSLLMQPFQELGQGRQADPFRGESHRDSPRVHVRVRARWRLDERYAGGRPQGVTGS